jgi:hypothetical protein
VIGVRKLIVAMMSVPGLIAESSVALPCGFEDPNSVSTARGFLNWMYPKALYVGTAVWSAQSQGTIARDERPEALKKLLGYHVAVERLGAFRDRLAASLDGGAVPAFSMVLFSPMLWTHYEVSGATLNMTPHVGGPSQGDVVIVTDEPVMVALIAGRVTPQTARELGLMRFYGSPEAVRDITNWLDRSLSGPGAKSVTGEDHRKL